MAGKTKAVIFGAVIIIAVLSLISMGVVDYYTDVKYDFIIAWAALFGGLGGVTSWIYKNETLRKNDSTKLSDARLERLSIIASDILEKTYHVHRAIQVIASPFSSAGEIYMIEDEKNEKSEEESKKRSQLLPNVSQAEIFAHRAQRYEKLFSEYYSLDVKAKVYFNDTVAGYVDEMKSIISFINLSINRLFRYSSEKSRRKDDKKAAQTEEEIWAFYDPENYAELLSTEDIRYKFKVKIESFASICENMDSELGSYVREN
jgi:hypothetical protein